MKKLRQLIARFGIWLAGCDYRPAPINYHTPPELYHYLTRKNYSPEIAQELSVDYARNLQLAFVKGYELGFKRGKTGNSSGRGLSSS